MARTIDGELFLVYRQANGYHAIDRGPVLPVIANCPTAKPHQHAYAKRHRRAFRRHANFIL